jgi:hypothetical protein
MNQTPKNKKYEIKVNLWLEHEIFYSKPYRLLSAKTGWVLQRFLQKRKWHPTNKRNRKPVFENEGIAFTYAEAIHFEISISTFHTSIKKLVQMGFIDVDHQGGAYGNDYSRYNISNRWRKYGTPEFEKVIKKRVLQKGLDVRSHQRPKLKVTTDNRS